MTLPKGFTLPGKLDIDWNLLKDADNFCSKIGNNGMLHYYGHELMVSVGAYKSWVNHYNELRGDEVWEAGSGIGNKSREDLFFMTLYSETKSRLILLGTDPREAGDIAMRKKKMMFFEAEFKGIREFKGMFKCAAIEPFESIRGVEPVEHNIRIEQGLGTATLFIEGTEYSFTFPQMLSEIHGNKINLWDQAGNLRGSIDYNLEP